MNPYLLSVSHSSTWLNDDELRPRILGAMVQPDWQEGLKKADEPAGEVIRQVLETTARNIGSEQERSHRQSLVAKLASVGLGLPSLEDARGEFSRDGFLAAMLAQAHEQGVQAWKDMEVVQGLVRACAKGRVGFTDVYDWLFKQNLHAQKPLVGATVEEVIAVMGMDGYHTWWVDEEGIRRRVGQLIHQHAIWVLEDDGLTEKPALAAIWLLAAEQARERMTYRNKSIDLLFDKLDALCKDIRVEHVNAIFEHPSAFFRVFAIAKAVGLFEKLVGAAEPDEAWKAAWKAAQVLRPYSMVCDRAASLLASVEEACGPCPLAIEREQPIELVQWCYATRLAQLTDHPSFSEWLRAYHQLADREEAIPYREVLGEVLGKTKVWPQTFNLRGWTLLEMDAGLEEVGIPSGSSKVRL